MLHADQQEELNQGHIENYEAEGQNHSGRSSPEMDFLEMDFDPGPSCEQVRYALHYYAGIVLGNYNVSISSIGYWRQ